jgi:hypothetical protein
MYAVQKFLLFKPVGKTSKMAHLTKQLVKSFCVLILAVIYFYLTAKSIGKYLSDPVSSKILYKFGEDDQGNGRFPKISFCKPSYDETQLKWKNQRDCNRKKTSSIHFLDFMNNCLTSEDENATVEELLTEITYEPEDIFFSIQSYFIAQLMQKDNWKNFKDLIFYDYYDMRNGHCLTLDVTKLTNDGQVRLSTSVGNFVIKLNLIVDYDDKGFDVYLHDNKDIYHLREFFPKITWLGTGLLKLDVHQKIIKSLPNEETPCVQQPFWTCYIEKTVEQLMEQYNCKIPFILKKSVNKMATQSHNSVEICNKNITLNTLKEWKDVILGKRKVNDCLNKVPCDQVKYSYDKTEIPAQSTNSTTGSIHITIASPMIEHVIDSYSYDFLGFFGECGGTLGLLLGLSCLSLIDVVLQYIIVSIKSLFH